MKLFITKDEAKDVLRQLRKLPNNKGLIMPNGRYVTKEDCKEAIESETLGEAMRNKKPLTAYIEFKKSLPKSLSSKGIEAMSKKSNYYVDEIDNALKDHDPEFPLTLKIYGSKNSSKALTLPFPLVRIIKEWYWLHGVTVNDAAIPAIKALKILRKKRKGA